MQPPPPPPYSPRNDSGMDLDYSHQRPPIVTPLSSAPPTAAHSTESLALSSADPHQLPVQPPRLNRFLPNTQHQILYEGRFTWHVQSFSNLRAEALKVESRKIWSPPFEVGGEKWCILMFPYGNNVDSLSLYIDFVEGKELEKSDPKWHRCVQFALRLYNADDECTEIFRDAQHRFNSDESDWGFTQFLRFADLTKAMTETQRPLLERDQFIIEAHIRVLRDETGTLWHNFVNWDSKVETGYVGLKNQGATCYMNSLLQSLYFTSQFRKAVYQIPTDNDEPTKSVALALQRVFYQLQTADDAVDTRELTKSFGWDTLDAFMQHDVQEFNRVLQDNLETKMKSTVAEGAIEKLFVGKMKSYIKCVNVDYESSREETFYDIQLNVKGKKDLYESFKDYVAVEMLDGENKYQSEKFGLQDAKKGVIFTKFPPVLHLQMKRFEYDFERDAMVKINDRHEYPLKIDLTEFLSEDVKSEPQVYHLHGVLVHIGDVHGGHYCAYIRPTPNGKWFKFDDDRVTPVTEKEVFEDNFGGNYMGNMGYPLSKQTRLHKRFTNAYMLVYVRESDLNTALATITENDIPKHLVESIKREQEERERAAREAVERHLYLDAKIIYSEMMKTQQVFDLADWGDSSFPPLHIKVKKTDLWKDFKEIVASTVSKPVETIRLWNMYKRQNGTIRAESPVDPKFDEKTVEEVYNELCKTFRDLKLFLEVAGHQVQDSDGKVVYFPQITPDSLVLFVKYYDAETGELEYIGSVRSKSSMRGQDLVPVLSELKSLPPNTPLVIYEEIKPGMVDVLKLKNTLAQSELMTGDIICFQKDVSKDVSKNYECPTAIAYYDYLQHRVTATFVPRIQPRDEKEAEKMEASGIPCKTVELSLSRKMTYDQFATKVGQSLKVDPFKLRFMINATGGDVPKQTIRRVPNQTFHEIISTNFYSPNVPLVFWYDYTDVSILELETKRLCKVTLVDEHSKELETVELLVSKMGTVGDLMNALVEKLKLEHKVVERLRIVEVTSNRIIKDLALDLSILHAASDYNSTLYAEIIPNEESNVGEHDKITTVFHFAKDPTRSHGVPFRFFLRPNEKFVELKRRLQERLGMNDKEFAKIRVFVVDETNRSMQLEDDNVSIHEQWNVAFFLGLEHPDRSATSKRVGGLEKSIKIHN